MIVISQNQYDENNTGVITLHVYNAEMYSRFLSDSKPYVVSTYSNGCLVTVRTKSLPEDYCISETNINTMDRRLMSDLLDFY